MSGVLIVTSSEKSIAPLAEILLQNGYNQIYTVGDCGEARRVLLERSFALCIINSPLPDETGEAFAVHVMTENAAQVLFIVRDISYEETTVRLAEYGVFTLSKPINKAMLWSTLKLITASRVKVAKLETEKDRLQKKMEEMTLINRAKCILIQYFGITEEQAHKYIEKQAMDLRITKFAVAKNILKTYEN